MGKRDIGRVHEGCRLLGLLGSLLLLTRRLAGRTHCSAGTRSRAVDARIRGEGDVGGAAGTAEEAGIILVGGHAQAGRAIAVRVVAVGIGIDGSFGMGNQVGLALLKMRLLASGVLGLDLVAEDALHANAFSPRFCGEKSDRHESVLLSTRNDIVMKW